MLPLYSRTSPDISYISSIPLSRLLSHSSMSLTSPLTLLYVSNISSISLSRLLSHSSRYTSHRPITIEESCVNNFISIILVFIVASCFRHWNQPIRVRAGVGLDQWEHCWGEAYVVTVISWKMKNCSFCFSAVNLLTGGDRPRFRGLFTTSAVYCKYFSTFLLKNIFAF